MKNPLYTKALLGFLGITVIVGAGVAYTVVTQNDQQPPAPEFTSIEARGASLYSENCLSCHGDQRAELVFGQPPPHNSDGHTWHHADGELKKWILNGKPFNMPAFKETLTEADIDAILAFLKTWWEPSQRKIQARISEQYTEMMEKYPQD